MAKYRKKPVVIDAELYHEGLEDGFQCEGCPVCGGTDKNCEYMKPYIQTLEGEMYISPNDYIITGVRGERYPCKKDIFEETYEKVED
jgi:hypothetical protein